jgi:molybdopterin-binding protein
MALRTSARNRLPGVITAVKRGDVMAQVDIRVGDNHIVSLISREAADELDLKEGDHVVAIVKATEVMVARTDGGEEEHAV